MALNQTDPNIQPAVAMTMARRSCGPEGAVSSCLSGRSAILLSAEFRPTPTPVTSISPGSAIDHHSSPCKAQILGWAELPSNHKAQQFATTKAAVGSCAKVNLNSLSRYRDKQPGGFIVSFGQQMN